MKSLLVMPSSIQQRIAFGFGLLVAFIYLAGVIFLMGSWSFNFENGIDDSGIVVRSRMLIDIKEEDTK